MERKIFNYCERGADPSFWAEPANAVTNAAFIIVGLICLAEIIRRPSEAWDWLASGLALLVVAIGIGSFLFHTYAEPWAGAADVIPILLFMLLGVYGVLKRFFNAPVWASLLGVVGFIGMLAVAGRLRCSDAGVSFGGAGGACFGGSIGYGPALLMLLVLGGALTIMRRPGGAYLFAAGGVFLASLTARTLDWPLCDTTIIGDYVLGTHFLWHILNGVTLYLVTMAVIRHGGRTDGDQGRAA